MTDRPQYVLELPEEYLNPDDSEVARMQAVFARAFEGGQPVVTPPGCKLRRVDGGAIEAQFDRLLALLALSPEERAFVQSALTGGDGEGFWQVFADYLAEKGVVGADRIRRTGPVGEPAMPEVQVRRREDRRLGVLRVSWELLADALRLPPDARIVRMSEHAYFAHGQLGLMIHDPAFPETEGGRVVPEVDLLVQRDDAGNVTTEWRL